MVETIRTTGELLYWIGNDFGWLGLQWQSAPYNSGTIAHVNGYPGYVNGHNNTPIDQYTRTGTVGVASKANMLESRDMFASTGDSGGPCYIYSDKSGYTAIGITSALKKHNDDWNDIDYVVFRTIDKSLYEKLVEFRTSTL